MIKIAVIDDDKNSVENLKNLIEEYTNENDIEILIKCFINGKEFLKVNNSEFSLIFLDIDMPKINGLDVARQMRETNDSSVLIFCTNFEQYAINGYEFDAFGFLIKPVSKPAIVKLLDRVFPKLNSSAEKIVVRTSTGNEVIETSKIVYVEVQRHILLFHVLCNGKMHIIRGRGSMNEVTKSINSENFGRCSVCYLVNLKYVLSIKNNVVSLPEENSLSITRSHKKKFVDAFMNYMSTHGVIIV